jgi:hypothetical protein
MHQVSICSVFGSEAYALVVPTVQQLNTYVLQPWTADPVLL